VADDYSKGAGCLNVQSNATDKGVVVELGQRVRITSESKDEMVGKLGTVVRLRRTDNGAWVNMDRDLPIALRSFPEHDPRRRHMLVYPDECEITE
jgi:hypothetical protein